MMINLYQIKIWVVNSYTKLLLKMVVGFLGFSFSEAPVIHQMSALGMSRAKIAPLRRWRGKMFQLMSWDQTERHFLGRFGPTCVFVSIL